MLKRFPKHVFVFASLVAICCGEFTIADQQLQDQLELQTESPIVFPDAASATSTGSPYLPGLYAANAHRKKRRLTQVSASKVITGMAGLRPYHCLARCLEAKSDCAAFNLDRTAGVCELLPAHLCNHSGLELEASSTFSYYDVYTESATEEGGIMYSSPYCKLKGFCNPECESLIHMAGLNEECSENYECQMKVGPMGICRVPPKLCKCDQGYYIHEDPEAETKSCAKLDAEGFVVFPNIKADPKRGLHFKLVMHDMDFERAANYCVEVEGGHLAYAEDGDTNRFLREYMRKNKVRSAYLGLTDQVQEGVWIWIHSGQKLKTAQFWKSGAPDNFNDIEHCAMITNEIDFGWDDVPCNKVGKFFCQRPETN